MVDSWRMFAHVNNRYSLSAICPLIKLIVYMNHVATAKIAVYLCLIKLIKIDSLVKVNSKCKKYIYKLFSRAKSNKNVLLSLLCEKTYNSFLQKLWTEMDAIANYCKTQASIRVVWWGVTVANVQKLWLRQHHSVCHRLFIAKVEKCFPQNWNFMVCHIQILRAYQLPLHPLHTYSQWCSPCRISLHEVCFPRRHFSHYRNTRKRIATWCASHFRYANCFVNEDWRRSVPAFWEAAKFTYLFRYFSYIWK